MKLLQQLRSFVSILKYEGFLNLIILPMHIREHKWILNGHTKKPGRHQPWSAHALATHLSLYLGY